MQKRFYTSWGILQVWLAMFCLPAGASAQSDVFLQWIDESGNPACELPDAGSTLHVSAWLDGVTQTAIQAEDLVVDSTGTCLWPQVLTGVYTLEALPWSWTLVIEPQSEVDTMTLIWPSRSCWAENRITWLSVATSTSPRPTARSAPAPGGSGRTNRFVLRTTSLCDPNENRYR